MVCLFSMCSRGVEGHQNDKFFIYKTCEKAQSEIVGIWASNQRIANKPRLVAKSFLFKLFQSIWKFILFCVWEFICVMKSNKNVIIHHVALFVIRAFSSLRLNNASDSRQLSVTNFDWRFTRWQASERATDDLPAKWNTLLRALI